MNEAQLKFTAYVNSMIDLGKEHINFSAGAVSDGFHSFDELYRHRCSLYLVLCKALAYGAFSPRANTDPLVWRSKTHSDGSEWPGWFILGVHRQPGKQFTYHLPIDRWDEAHYAATLEKAPTWDGHTSDEAEQRILSYLTPLGS